MLSSFFWGYLWTQIIAGNLAEKYGSKTILTATTTVLSLLVVLTPYAATIGYQMVCAFRVFEGAMQVRTF